MGWIIGLAVIAVLGGFIAAALLVGAGLREGGKQRKNAPALLDEKFDGQRGTTTWTVQIGSLTEAEVIEGAAERGYRMTGSTQRGRSGPTTLAFERIA